MCMIDGAEGAELWKSNEQKSRKQHTCEECGRTITKGEIYRRVFIVCAGYASAYKSCSHCMIAQDWLLIQCGGFLTQGVYEDIYEHFEAAKMCKELPAFWLGRVVVGMRAQWLSPIKKKILPILKLPL